MTDEENARVQGFDPMGNFITQWPVAGITHKVKVNNGNVYVAAYQQNCIMKYTLNGTFVSQMA